jgi:hypothetical protein
MQGWPKHVIPEARITSRQNGILSKGHRSQPKELPLASNRTIKYQKDWWLQWTEIHLAPINS